MRGLTCGLCPQHCSHWSHCQLDVSKQRAPAHMLHVAIENAADVALTKALHAGHAVMVAQARGYLGLHVHVLLRLACGVSKRKHGSVVVRAYESHVPPAHNTAPHTLDGSSTIRQHTATTKLTALISLVLKNCIPLMCLEHPYMGASHIPPLDQYPKAEQLTHI